MEQLQNEINIRELMILQEKRKLTGTVNGSPTSINSNQALKKFSELVGEPISEGEETVLIKNFPEYMRLLKRGRLNKQGAILLLRLIRSTVKSQTIQFVRCTYSYIFGKSIDTGGGRSILQKVFSLRTGCFLCAKVFLNADALFEYKLSRILGPHENIAPISRFHSIFSSIWLKRALNGFDDAFLQLVASGIIGMLQRESFTS